MSPIDILNRHNLKRTSCREGIIEVIMTANEALSENEIRERLSGNYDRTTFYRSFKTLEEYKIIHKIVVDNQLVKYALDYPLPAHCEIEVFSEVKKILYGDGASFQDVENCLQGGVR